MSSMVSVPCSDTRMSTMTAVAPVPAWALACPSQYCPNLSPGLPWASPPLSFSRSAPLSLCLCLAPVPHQPHSRLKPLTYSPHIRSITMSYWFYFLISPSPSLPTMRSGLHISCASDMECLLVHWVTTFPPKWPITQPLLAKWVLHSRCPMTDFCTQWCINCSPHWSPD